MNNKHTKGNWRYSEQYALITVSKPGSVEGSKKICDLNENVSFGENEGELKANALLIAAAPDLFQACLDFVAKVDSGKDRSTESYKQMKAAITKATGGNHE